MRTPQLSKVPRIRTPKPRLSRPHSSGPSAFPANGKKAFSDPATMQAPDQAFGAAMALPQGAATSGGG